MSCKLLEMMLQQMLLWHAAHTFTMHIPSSYRVIITQSNVAFDAPAPKPEPNEFSMPHKFVIKRTAKRGRRRIERIQQKVEYDDLDSGRCGAAAACHAGQSS